MPIPVRTPRSLESPARSWRRAIAGYESRLGRSIVTDCYPEERFQRPLVLSTSESKVIMQSRSTPRIRLIGEMWTVVRFITRGMELQVQPTLTTSLEIIVRKRSFIREAHP